jgi:glycine cleavage system H protein
MISFCHILYVFHQNKNGGCRLMFYTKEHEWVEIDDSGDEDFAVVGISKHAADELGDITFIELPEIESDIISGDELSVVESVKAALINRSPEAEGWICKISNVDNSELDNLMDEEAYSKYIKSL